MYGLFLYFSFGCINIRVGYSRLLGKTPIPWQAKLKRTRRKAKRIPRISSTFMNSDYRLVCISGIRWASAHIQAQQQQPCWQPFLSAWTRLDFKRHGCSRKAFQAFPFRCVYTRVFTGNSERAISCEQHLHAQRILFLHRYPVLLSNLCFFLIFHHLISCYSTQLKGSVHLD
jgi:hypothetical protein